jgi:hypothetical protein
MLNSSRHAIAELIGHRASAQPRTVPISMIDDLGGGVAVYVTETIDGRTLYVGSVHRPNNPYGVLAHLREHLRRTRRNSWEKITIFPMSALTPEREVRQIEGTVATWLVPDEGHAWPRVRKH